GLAIGSRIMGGFGAIYALAALALLVAASARRDGLRPASAALGRFTLAMLPAGMLALAVGAVVWPWVVPHPPNFFRALRFFSRFFAQPWYELYGGSRMFPPDMPRSYVPTLMALKLPELFLALGFGGTAGALIAACRRDLAPSRRAVLLALALAALLP